VPKVLLVSVASGVDCEEVLEEVVETGAVRSRSSTCNRRILYTVKKRSGGEEGICRVKELEVLEAHVEAEGRGKREEGREAERQRGKRGREAERQRGREAEGRGQRAERQRGRGQRGRGQRDRETERQRGREAERQTGRQADRQTGRQADRQRADAQTCLDRIRTDDDTRYDSNDHI
jgi:hypothetical protein